MVVGELAHERDLIIIGGGPGGYHAAIRAAQLGQSVTLIEKEKLGGICLNKGCIPSKIFTNVAEKLLEMKGFGDIGIESQEVTLNFSKLQNHKNKTIESLRAGVEALCKTNNVEIIIGTASFLSTDRIGVENGEQYDVYRFQHAIIAAGGIPSIPNNVHIDHERILNPWSVTTLNSIPEQLLIYGNDYIALEMAFAFHAFRSRITLILEEEDFKFDQSINRELKRILKKKGLKVISGSRIRKADLEGENVKILLENQHGTEELVGTHLFVSSTIIPNIATLGLQRIGIEMTDTGFIKVDKHCRTSIHNIYAIGDITEGPSLAVKAIKQGKTAAEAIAGIPTEVDLRFIPIIAQTTPPIATVGLTEQAAVELGFDVQIGQIPLSSNGFAAIHGKKEGIIKVIFDKESYRLLGMHMIGHGAIELISSGILSLEMISRDEDLRFPFYPHPSMNESLLEAVEAINNQAIHLIATK